MKMFRSSVLMILAVAFLSFGLSAQTGGPQGSHQGPGPAHMAGFGGMMGHDLENLPLGTTLLHEVKKLTGQSLFSDRLIPVFSANGVEYEMRLPPMAFSGANLKQGDSLEIQGVFATLKTPDGKIVNWVRPLIVKVGGKEINLKAFYDKHKGEGRHEAGRGEAKGMGPGMGPSKDRK